MAIREYLCNYCGHQFDTLAYGATPEDYKYTDCRCGSQAEVLPSRPSTPRGNFGTTHRNTGSDKPQKFNFENDEPVVSPFRNRKES